MKNSFRRVLSCFLVLIIVVGLSLPTFAIESDLGVWSYKNAAYDMETTFSDKHSVRYVYSSNTVSGFDFTDSPALAQKLDSIFTGTLPLYVDKKYDSADSLTLGSVMNTKKTYYWPGYSASQCMAYGYAVFYKLFNTIPYSGNTSKGDYIKDVSLAGKTKVTYKDFVDAGIKCGAYVRITNHSMIVLGYDENGIAIIGGNQDYYTGKTSNANYKIEDGVCIEICTWDNFNTHFLKNGHKFEYVAMMSDSYYRNNYPGCDHDWHGKNENGNYFVKCSICKREYAIKEASQNSSYRIKASAKTYSAPYSNSAEKSTLRVNDQIDVVASTVNAYGNTWFKLRDGSWVYYGKYENGKLTDNKYIYQNPINTCTHKWEIRIESSKVVARCTSCGYVFEQKEVAENNVYKIKAKTKTHYGPYSGTLEKKTLKVFDYIEVVASVENVYGNTWLKLKDGSWVYYGKYVDGILTDNKFVVKCVPKGTQSTTVSGGSYMAPAVITNVTETKPTYTGYVVDTSSLDINSNAASGNKIGSIPSGESCTVDPNKSVGMWQWVTYKGTSGYAYGSNISKTAPIIDAWIKVNTNAATEITATSAKLNGSLSADMNVHITEHGAYLGTSTSNMTRVAKDTVDHNKSSLTMYYSTSKYGTTLQSNTTYYFYEYAVVDGVTYKGDVLSFKTLDEKSSVTVTTNGATEITATSAKLNGSLSASKSVHITEHGAYLGTSTSNMTRVAKDTVDYNKSSLTMFYSTSKYGTTLQPNTTYYFYEYAVVDGVTYKGDVLSFITPDDGEAEVYVTTNAATNITPTSAQLNGSLSASDKVHVTEHGAYLGTSPSNMKRVARDSVDKNVSSLTMFYSTSKYGTTLQPNTTYYFCEYAVIDGDFYEGDTLSFTTPPEDSKPVSISVSTNAATNITQTSAQLNGSLSASDKVHVTEHGAYLGTSTSNMTRVAKDSVDKNVSSLTMFYSTSKYGTTLKAGTTYYFYQYAVIDGVTYEGSIVSFTTAAETKTENTRKGVVTSDGYLAINDKPAASPANSTKIGRIPSGATVTVYPDKTSGNWYWVSYDGVSGYAYSKYIKLQ